jgi:hypothetical protein
MSGQLRAAELPDSVHRLGRLPDPWAWPDWSHAGLDGAFGNRFDDPEGEYRVLYASTQRLGTLLETLARFRPDPAVLAAEVGSDPRDVAFETNAPGTLDAERWLAGRAMGTGRLVGQFCALGHSASLAYLRRALGGRLVQFGVDDLDASDIRVRAPRALTQELSRVIYEHHPGGGADPFAGIAYRSRLGDDLENWALFEPNEPISTEHESLQADDPDFLLVVERFGLTLL